MNNLRVNINLTEVQTYLVVRTVPMAVSLAKIISGLLVMQVMRYVQDGNGTVGDAKVRSVMPSDCESDSYIPLLGSPLI
jgi:hypothetical protein